MIYKTKRFSLKGAALYGGGYIVGGLAGEAVGKKIGEHIKRELGPKDLKKTESELKELRKFLEVHKNQRFSGLSIRKYEDNPEICRVINLNGVSNDNPDDYDFGMMNKNKAKITKSIQEAIKAKEEILKDPKNHPGNYGNLGRKIGGTIGVGGGLLAAHKLKKFSKIGEFVDTVKKARKYNKHRLTYKELKDLGISVYEPSGMNMNAIDKEILESREAMGKLEKLGKKTAKGVAIGSAIAGGLYLGKKIYDKQKKTKNQPNEEA